MKKLNLMKRWLLSITAFALAGCRLSDVSPDGTTKEPIWPKVEDAGINFSGSEYGIWPNWDNVRRIERGMNKEQLYYLIGRPHFSEGLFSVREWDYVFNYRQNGEHKICQYKVLFDKNMNVQSFFWKPERCDEHEQYELSGDFLFEFNSPNLTEYGEKMVIDIAERLKLEDVSKLTIIGYTDKIGLRDYNLKLSQQRAESVKLQLVKNGINSENITTSGRGSADPVKLCENEIGQALKDCLRPNRRVLISSEQTSTF